MGIERRRHIRKHCSVPCEVQAGGMPVSGSTRDVSMGGLSVQADLEVDQGDAVHLVLHPDRVHEVVIQAIVWHQRRVRERRSGREFTLMGLVLSEAPDDFHEQMGLSSEALSAPSERKSPRAPGATGLRRAASKKPRTAGDDRPGPGMAKGRSKKESHAGGARSAPSAPTARPASPAKPPDAPGLPRPKRYRVRVTMTGQPRTRSILVFAANPDEARANSLAETGAGWEILEIEQA